MPKAKRLNGIWGGRARRALGAAVIAMVLVFARALAALGQGTPDYIRDAISECDPQRYDFCKDLDEFLTVETSRACLKTVSGFFKESGGYEPVAPEGQIEKEKVTNFMNGVFDRKVLPSELSLEKISNSSEHFRELRQINITPNSPASWYAIQLYDRCIRDYYISYMDKFDSESFGQGEKYRYFVRTIARKIDENHPEAGAYDKLNPVYKDDDENRSDASTEAPTVEGTTVLYNSRSILLITVAAAETESALIKATQAQIAALTAQAQATQATEIAQALTAQAQTVHNAPTSIPDAPGAESDNGVVENGAVHSESDSGNQAISAFDSPTGGEGIIISTPIPTLEPTSTATLTARPSEITVPGTDSVDINPLAPSKTDVSTPGGIWDKIKKYLRELIIAAAGLVGIGAVWTLIRKRKRRPARPERIRPAAARPAPVRPAAAPEARDIREPRENRTLRLEDGVGTDPKTMEIQAMSAVLKFDFGNMQHQGRRDYQEDSFGFSDISDPELVAKRGILAIVADGMGGLKNGKSISERAIGKFRKAFLNFSPAGNIPRQLSSLVAETNHDIYETDRQKGGTTLICVYIYRNGMHWVSVGDSAIFLFRQGRLYQLNKEHNRLNELYLKFMYREITKEQLMAEPSLQGLTSNIGRRELRDLDQNLTGLRLQSGDRILLCTDGVSGRLTEKELLVAMSQGTAQACADAMKSMVLKKNAPKQDNLTAEVICCD